MFLARRSGLLAVVLSVVAFILLGSRYGLLGDNMLRVREAEQGALPSSEAGMMLLYHLLVRLGRGHASARQVFAAVSVAAGAIYAWASWSLARRLGSELARGPGSEVAHPLGSPSRLLFAGLITAGSVELFCGYLEVYPLVLAGLLITIWAASAAAEGRISVLAPVLLLAVCVFLHRAAILWMPAAVSPIWIRLLERRPARRSDPRRAAASVLSATSPPGSPPAWLPGGPIRRAIGAVLAGGILAGLLLAGRSSFLLPLSSPAERPYTLFSPAHISDYLNAQFLGCTAAFLLGPIAIAIWTRLPRIGPASLIACLSWLIPASGLWFFRPILGGADWDILSLAAPFGFLFVATVWRDAAAAGHIPRPSWARWVALAVALSAFNTIPWLAVQAGGASIARARDLIETDRADYFRGHPAPLHLAFVFGANGLPDLQREELLRGMQSFPDDPRYPYDLAALARRRGDWKEAEAYALASCRAAPGYVPPLEVLYDAYKARGARGDQARVGRAILQAFETDPQTVERYLRRERIEQIQREVGSQGAP